MQTLHLAGARILVGEHEELIRAWLDEQLRDRGVDVVDVVRAEDLLCALVDQGPFDAVICDQDIPDRGHRDVVALTRSAGLKLPFIVLSATGSAGGAGVHHDVTVLPRSCNADTLVSLLDSAMKSYDLDLAKCVFVACAACGRAHIADLWPPLPSLCAHCEHEQRDELSETHDDLGEGD